MEEKYIIDTNVPVQAAKSLEGMSDIEAQCKERCFEFIERFIGNSQSKLILDADFEVCKEYIKNINQKSEPNIAVIFLMWVFNYLKKIPIEDLVHLHKSSTNTYFEFPVHAALKGFDPTDRKFIALSNAHPQNPKIVQGTDYKWKKYRKILNEFNVVIIFLCEEYIDYRISTK